MAFDESASYVVIRYAPKAWDRGQDPLTRKVNVPAGLSELQAERWLNSQRLIKSGETIVSFHLSATKAGKLSASLVIAANALIREAKTLHSAADVAPKGSTRDELADLMLTHARLLALEAGQPTSRDPNEQEAARLREALLAEYKRIAALPGPKPEKTPYYTDPSIDVRTEAAYTYRAPKKRKETEMDDERGSLWDALKRALKSNPKREKAYNYAPGQIANRTVSQAESDVAHAIDACYNAGKNLKRLEEAISRLEDVLQNIDEASSLARRKSDVPTLRALEAIYNKGELEMNRYEEKLSRIEMNRGSKWSSLHAKEASEKAGGPGAKAADAFALMATEAAAQAGFIDRGETEIFIRKGPIERAINAIGTGKAQDEARKLLRNMVGMAQGPINPTEGSRGISMKLVAASLRTIAEHANEQARMYASMTVPGSKEESMTEKADAGDIKRLSSELGLAISAANRKMNSRTLMTDDDDEKMSDLLAGAEQFLQEMAGLEVALRGLRNNFNELDRIYNLAKSRNLFKEAREKGTDDDGEQWDEQGWGRAVDANGDPIAEDGDTLEGIMKAARSEKAGFPFQKKKKPAADPNAEADPNAQQGQQPAQQQAPGKAPPFGKKKVPTPGQQPGMPQTEQNPQDSDEQDVEDPAAIQTDAQGNQLGTNGEFAGQTVGSMTADQFGTALAAAMQPVIQAIAALNAATVQRTKEATDAAEARIANLEGEQPVMTRLERGYRASQKGPAPADAATYPMPNSAPSTEETFLDWALNGKNGARP